MKENNNHEKDDNFAELFERSLPETRSFEPGQQVEARIVAISGDCIFLHLGGKSEGQLDANELMDKEGKLSVNVGDTVKAFFISEQYGEKHFTTRIGSDKASKALLQNAFESGIPVEGVVEKEKKGGYEVRLGESTAFCPFSQMGLQRVENSEVYIGKTLTFMIQEYGEKGRNILVSNRVILQAEQNAQLEILKKTLQEKMRVKGIIKSLHSFGAFVEIQGIKALLPISEISRVRVEDINELLKVGQEIEAIILKLDWKNERISVSMKQLLPDPWDEVPSKYQIGSIHKGKIVRLENYGAFVELEPGLDGLIHVSDLEKESRIQHPRDVVKAGQTIAVQIDNIDLEKKRISLKPKPQESEDFTQYMDTESDTYNPFSALLKPKGKPGK